MLLAQQKKEKVFGKWGLPGGKAEAGESPLQAVVREIREELGVELDDSFTETCVTHQGTAPDETHLTVTTYLARLPKDTPLHLQEDELIGFGWFTLADLRSLGSAMRSSWIQEMVEKALERYDDHDL